MSDFSDASQRHHAINVVILSAFVVEVHLDACTHPRSFLTSVKVLVLGLRFTRKQGELFGQKQERAVSGSKTQNS